jgi:type IV pilus assembly protein PilX
MIAKQAYITPARSQYTSKNSEKGITLIMVLIFMVTLSLVAAVGMRGVITGDKVVANERDRTLAFQAAESAGREAVALITTNTHTPNYATIGGKTQGGNAEFWRTTSTLTKATGCTPAPGERFNWEADGTGCATESAVDYDNTAKPRYFIEIMNPDKTNPAVTNCWYRVTSRATGKTRESEVILQLMFAIPHNSATHICT